MSEQHDAPEREDEDLALDTDTEDTTPQDDEHDDGGAEDGDDGEGSSDGDAGGDDDGEDVVISFDGEGDDADETDLPKRLRTIIRDQAAKLAAYERGEAPAAPKTIEVGPKPKLEDFYEKDDPEAAFEEAYEAWQARKAEAAAQQSEATKRAEAVNARFAEKLADYGTKKQALKVRDFDAAEEVATAALSQVQQAIVVKAADDAAKVIYALGKSPQRMATLAAIEDPIEFTAALVKMEGQLKVTTRQKTPPAPDSSVRGSAPLSDPKDKVLERLEAEADRTGDRTKVVQYKRQLRDKQMAKPKR